MDGRLVARLAVGPLHCQDFGNAPLATLAFAGRLVNVASGVSHLDWRKGLGGPQQRKPSRQAQLPGKASQRQAATNPTTNKTPQSGAHARPQTAPIDGDALDVVKAVRGPGLSE